MTPSEIVLFKELIKETVRACIKEERDQMKEDIKVSFKKDLKEIKLLLSAVIKENRQTIKRIQNQDNSGNLADYVPNNPILFESINQAVPQPRPQRGQPEFVREVVPLNPLAKAAANDPSIKNAPSLFKDILLETANNMKPGEMSAFLAPA